MRRLLFYSKAMIFTLTLVGVLGACNGGSPTPTSAVSPTSEIEVTPSFEARASNTPVIPTNTPQPVAVWVNGSEITLDDYQTELALYQAAVGAELTSEDEQRVLNNLVDETLLAQAAGEGGFAVTEAILDERMVELNDQLGGGGALEAWISEHGYSKESFRRALNRSVSAAWKRDQILNLMPDTAEHVNAFQILLYNLDEANQIYAQLQAGYDFYNLAIQYDPITGGDLGWFPRGYLPDKKLEDAIFSLELNEWTPVMETLAGFHIVMLLDRDPQRLLSPGAVLALQAQFLQEWLGTRRSESEINVLLP